MLTTLIVAAAAASLAAQAMAFDLDVSVETAVKALNALAGSGGRSAN